MESLRVPQREGLVVWTLEYGYAKWAQGEVDGFEICLEVVWDKTW